VSEGGGRGFPVLADFTKNALIFRSSSSDFINNILILNNNLLARRLLDW
jgi:hypothetical protein